MSNFIQKIIYWILSQQEKTLAKKYGNISQKVVTNSTTKTVLTNSCTLNLCAETEKTKQKLEHNVNEIVKKYSNDPKKLLEYIERHNTAVYKLNFADKLLAPIKEVEGLIPAAKGVKALYLSLIAERKLRFKTEAMFILRDGELDPYYMIHQFHKWYAMKLHLPGFEAKAQDDFNKFLEKTNDKELTELNVEDILSLKEAIARDVEAINFVVNIAKTTEQAKKASQKLTAGGATI